VSRQVADFHCVTTWSKLDNVWEGVSVVDLMKRVRLKPEARYVIVHCDGGYTTNLPLEEFIDDDVILAWRHDGRDLEPDHGWPASAGGAEALRMEEREVGARDRIRVRG
jgi:DMSO/TMAO reductase YedYZ molybdopterin-dependent catalytic subunit